MGYIQKRVRNGKTKYRARVVAPGRREVSKTFDLKADAEIWVREHERRRQRGEWVDPGAGKVAFGEWLDTWAATRHGRPSTAARDESYMRNHLRPAFESVPVAAIRQPDVVAWVGTLQGKGLAPATVIKAYQLLAGALQGAADAGLIAASPCRNVPLPRVERREMRFLDHDEIARLAEAMDVRYRAMVLTLAYAGLRIGEAIALQPHRLLPARRELDIVTAVTWVKGRPHQGPPKSRSGLRRVSLPREVWDVLTEHVEVHATEWVFPSPHGGLIQPATWRTRFWLPATRAAGLEGLRIHDLRHTAVSLWIASGGHPKSVSTRAGHSSVAFTLDRYGHLYPDADEALADRLGEAMARSRDTSNVVELRPGG